MRQPKRCPFTASVPLIGLMLMLLVTGGCANPQAQVTALSSQEVAALSADDVVPVMRRAGFSDEQILELGTDLRNSLATSGAAQIRVHNKVEAIFAVDGRWLHVASRRRGSFIYDLEKHAFR